jgi:hypothetical protein
MVKLATERKHLTDIIKMVAYQAESDLLALLRPHYAHVDQEGRTLLHELFATAGDIRVSDSELNIASMKRHGRAMQGVSLLLACRRIATRCSRSWISTAFPGITTMRNTP